MNFENAGNAKGSLSHKTRVQSAMPYRGNAQSVRALNSGSSHLHLHYNKNYGEIIKLARGDKSTQEGRRPSRDSASSHLIRGEQMTIPEK